MQDGGNVICIRKNKSIFFLGDTRAMGKSTLLVYSGPYGVALWLVNSWQTFHANPLQKPPQRWTPGFDPLWKMASYHEHGSNSDVETKQPVVSRSHAVAERRRAALAEVDNAKFS